MLFSAVSRVTGQAVDRLSDFGRYASQPAQAAAAHVSRNSGKYGSAVTLTFLGGVAAGITAAFGKRELNDTETRQKHFDSLDFSSEKREEGQKILNTEKDKNVFSIHSDNARDEYKEFLDKNNIDANIYPYTGLGE